MPAFVKTPKFIISTIFLLWLISVIWENHNEPPVYVFYAPFFSVQLRLVYALLIAAAFGAIIALIAQYMWTHRASKKATSSLAA